MGREKSTKVFSFEAKKCPCGAFLPENSECCNDKHEVLIIDDFQTQALSFAIPAPEFVQLFEILQTETLQLFAYASRQYYTPDFSPPPKEPLFKLNCSFVFYDEELS